MLPAGLEERYRELRRRPTLRRQLKADREAAIVAVEYATSEYAWLPRVPLPPPANEPPPRRVERPEDGDMVAGLDASGRPVLVRYRPETGEVEPLRAVHPSEDDDEVLHVRLLAWSERRLEIVGFLTADSVSHVTWIDLDAQGRPLRFATRGVPGNDLGRGARLAECKWDGDRCVEVREGVVDDTPRAAVFENVHRAVYGEDGELQLVESAAGDGTPQRVWDRSLHAWEADPLDERDAIEAYFAAIGRAAWRAVGELAVPDPFMVRLGTSWNYTSVIVGSARYRDAVRGRRIPTADKAFGLSEPSADLIPLLDDEGRRALRSLRQRERSWRSEESATISAAAERLLRSLDELPWPGRAEPFLPLVAAEVADRARPDEPGSLRLARRVLGDARVDDFLASLAPPSDGAAPPTIAHPPASQDELAAILRQFDLPPELAEQSAWGAAIVAGGRGVSRLGGRAELPLGHEWPTFEGHALTHLATLDFSEVPDFAGRDVLPRDGRLVVFADLTEEGELWEPVVVGDDERVVVLHIPAGAATHQPEPPKERRDEYDVPVVLRPRRVAFRPVLTLPERPGALSEAERLSYEALYYGLQEVTPGLADPGHLLLGHPVVVQEDPREPGQVSVLHLGWDEGLRFEFLDGGDLTLFGDEHDVRAGRWDRLTLSAASC